MTDRGIGREIRAHLGGRGYARDTLAILLGVASGAGALLGDGRTASAAGDSQPKPDETSKASGASGKEGSASSDEEGALVPMGFDLAASVMLARWEERIPQTSAKKWHRAGGGRFTWFPAYRGDVAVGLTLGMDWVGRLKSEQAWLDENYSEVAAGSPRHAYRAGITVATWPGEYLGLGKYLGLNFFGGVSAWNSVQRTWCKPEGISDCKQSIEPSTLVRERLTNDTGFAFGLEVPLRYPLLGAGSDAAVQAQLLPSVRLDVLEHDTPWVFGLGLGFVVTTDPQNSSPATSNAEGAMTPAKPTQKAASSPKPQPAAPAGGAATQTTQRVPASSGTPLAVE